MRSKQWIRREEREEMILDEGQDPGTLELSDALPKRELRRPVELSGYATLPDGALAKVTIADLSYQGCSIAVPAPLEAGQTIQLSVVKRGAVEAEVRWCSNGKAGLLFKEEAPAKSQKPRSSERVVIDAEVTLMRTSESRCDVRVSDLSPEGCKVELVERLEPGERMMLRFSDFELLNARVCWVEACCAGLRFAEPIHPAAFDLLLFKLRRARTLKDCELAAV